MLDVPAISAIISAAIDEDYRDGDITSRLCFPEEVLAEAEIVAREDLVVCGLEIVDIIIAEFGFDIDATYIHEDGSRVRAGTVLVELSGSAYELLAVERTILNFLQRLSGVATHTAEFVQAAGAITVLDTRKTLPGWRFLDKYATRVGGAKNHRMNLAEMILLKDTHIDASGSLDELLDRVCKTKPFYIPLEVEVRTLVELAAVLQYPVTAVMLDNMETDTIKKALIQIAAVNPAILVEVSGGITLERLAELQECSTIAVSVGALTTQARNRDIAMAVRLIHE